MTEPRLPEFTQGDCVAGDMDTHEWQPLSFVFETQLLDKDGRVNVRQPDIDAGRVYCVCMRCHQHTYIVTKWAGFFLPDPWVLQAEDDDSKTAHQEAGEEP
jgi:hypothetical protein